MLAAAVRKQRPPRIDPEVWVPLGRVCTPRLTVCMKLQLRCNSRKPLTCANAVSGSTSNTQLRTYPKEGRAHPRGAYVLWSGTRPPCAVCPPPSSTHVPRSIGNVFAREAYLRSSHSRKPGYASREERCRRSASVSSPRPRLRVPLPASRLEQHARGITPCSSALPLQTGLSASVGRNPSNRMLLNSHLSPSRVRRGRARTRCAPARLFLRPVVHRERRRPCVVHSRQGTQRMWLVGLCTRLMG